MTANWERFFASQELYSNLIDYWHDVDTNWGRNAAEYYTADAVFEGTQATYRGREEIRRFYQWRLDRGARVAAHTVSNFRVELIDPATAVCTWYLLLYAADGQPVLPTHPPIQLSLMTDRCVRDAEGRWLCEHRKFEPWFEGGTPATNPKLTERPEEAA